MKMSATTESFVATHTYETQHICTTDTNDIESAEPKDKNVVLTVPENVDSKVLEGCMLINFLKPTKQNIFTEYVRTAFVPKVTKELQTIEHVIVFDIHKRDSLKGTTCQKRGTRLQWTKVKEQIQAPKNWHYFLRTIKTKQSSSDSFWSRS